MWNQLANVYCSSHRNKSSQHGYAELWQAEMLPWWRFDVKILAATFGGSLQSDLLLLRFIVIHFRRD